MTFEFVHAWHTPQTSLIMGSYWLRSRHFLCSCEYMSTCAPSYLNEHVCMSAAAAANLELLIKTASNQHVSLDKSVYASLHVLEFDC